MRFIYNQRKGYRIGEASWRGMSEVLIGREQDTYNQAGDPVSVRLLLTVLYIVHYNNDFINF